MNALPFAHLTNRELQNLFETGSDKLKSIIKTSKLPNHLKQTVPYFQQAVPGSNYYVDHEFNFHINRINSKSSVFHLNIRSLNCHHKISERNDLKIAYSTKVKIEDLWVEIANDNGEKHIISVIYRHPGGDVK